MIRIESHRPDTPIQFDWLCRAGLLLQYIVQYNVPIIAQQCYCIVIVRRNDTTFPTFFRSMRNFGNLLHVIGHGIVSIKEWSTSRDDNVTTGPDEGSGVNGKVGNCRAMQQKEKFNSNNKIVMTSQKLAGLGE